MNAISIKIMRRAFAISKLHTWSALGDAIDAFVVDRMRRAVPENHLREADREVDRCRHLLPAQGTPRALT